ncbi:glycine--tRNA ligase subunit beta [Desulfopila sp. IMCC35008]|uniref:glycine--tRNA ligase subunit beta n=1 Tax=Desulfopila sp. IMCC35008 TaxID=2653858 RepID=UPI0013D5E635|nr:glycine--tRNA ligase subunit beta [Desulfopila sp. IMCC35008]
MRDLLYEIGTEELPASFVKPALKQLHDSFIAKTSELKIDHGAIELKGTPRRLALIVRGLAEKQPDIHEELVGPSVKAGVDGDGKYTKAAIGFAKSRGAEVTELSRVDTPKGEYLMLVREVNGQETLQLLKSVLHELLIELSFPKSMRWGVNHHAFARPIQWLLPLYGEEIIPLEHEGIIASNSTMGHRFHHNHPIIISSVDEYEKALLEHDIIVDIDERRGRVVKEITAAVEQTEFTGRATVAVDENLVDLVTNLVEKPFGVCGRFEDKFLQVPDEVLITSMREHQKYFPVIGSDGKLQPGFVAVNNTKVRDTAITRKGHERVLRARLEDALFFFNSDCAGTLEDKRKRLDGIIFQAKLGTMLEKSDRLIKLAVLLCKKTGSEKAEKAGRAAFLCKADLISDMVGEFPSLQGVMGSAYAINDKEDEEVALAIREHYMPKRAGAELPSSELGALVGLADRIDTIAGCFGINQVPTGTADPFGLRRLSLAVLSIINSRGYSLSLREIMHKALALYGDKVDGSSDTVEKICAFIQGRFTNDCVAKGIDSGVVEAVTAVEFDDVCNAIERIDALNEIKKEDAFPVLAASFKRIRNITKDTNSTDVAPALFCEKAEKELYSIFVEVESEMKGLLANGDYPAALHAMLKMKKPVDTFFDDVMVMADDDKIRQNRLNMLRGIGQLILQIADISKIQEGK